MKWSDDFSTGVTRLDDQHKMIFRMTADFRLALDEADGARTYGEFLGFLAIYVDSHFGFESGCMAQHHCPVAKLNDQEHARFETVLEGYKQRFGVSGFTPGEARRLVDTVDAWLANHICSIDVKLKASVGLS